MQSYLEGMCTGLEQLHSTLAEVRHVQRALESVQKELASSTDSFQKLQPLREVALEHAQLGSVARALPRLFSGEASLARSPSRAALRVGSGDLFFFATAR